jgi:hypothetical protein
MKAKLSRFGGITFYGKWTFIRKEVGILNGFLPKSKRSGKGELRVFRSSPFSLLF